MSGPSRFASLAPLWDVHPAQRHLNDVDHNGTGLIRLAPCKGPEPV